MTIIGMNYNKILAEKTSSVRVKNINTAPKITAVKKSKLNGVGAKNVDVLIIGFEYATEYTPDAGKIQITGDIVYSSEKTDEIDKAWKKDKKLPAKLQVLLINHLFRNVSVKALALSDMLKMPPVVNLPRLEIKKKE